jgi:hypothetical protein
MKYNYINLDDIGKSFDAIKRRDEHEMYEATAGVTQHTILK